MICLTIQLWDVLVIMSQEVLASEHSFILQLLGFKTVCSTGTLACPYPKQPHPDLVLGHCEIKSEISYIDWQSKSVSLMFCIQLSTPTPMLQVLINIWGQGGEKGIWMVMFWRKNKICQIILSVEYFHIKNLGLSL